MQKIRKILRAVSEIFKDGPTDGPLTTDHGPWTDMGDYIGPSRVNRGSKMLLRKVMPLITQNINNSIISIPNKLRVEI